jgi:phage terminase large subunit
LLKWRVKNTYEHLEGIKKHPLEDLISFPDEPRLIADLSKPTVKYRGSKLLIESKQDLRKRGVNSPDYGDSLAYCFYEGVSPNWIDSI